MTTASLGTWFPPGCHHPGPGLHARPRHLHRPGRPMGQRRRHRGEGQQTHQQGEVQRQDWRRGGGADRGGAAEALEGR